MAETEEVITDENIETNCKITDLISSLKNVFLAEHIFGIYRFSIRDNQLLHSTWINKLYALFLIVFNTVAYTYFLDLEVIIQGHVRVVDFLDEVPCIIVLIQYLITLVTTTVFFNKVNKKMFVALADLDNQLMTANMAFYRNTATKANKFLLLLLFSHIVVSITDIAVGDEIDVGEIFFLPLFLVQKLEIVLFCLLIEMLRSRLDIINGYFTKFLSEKDDMISVFTLNEREGNKTLNFIGRPSENNMKIRDLALIYDTIGSICFMINDIFNFQIFMTLVSTFVYIVITIWTSLYYYQTPETSATSGTLINIVVWCVTTLLTVATMCFVCERLLSNRNTTKVLVNQVIMDYGLPNIMRVQAKAFMELIEAWSLRILIYDMFSVDISLMLKFISVSTTYLVVIIQISHLG